MQKKGENNSQNPPNKQKINQQTNLEPNSEQVHKTPDKKKQYWMNEEVFSLMSPFPLPPKINIQHTAISQGYNAFSHDMKVIQTPYNNNYPLFRPGDMQEMHDDLRGISSKIQWDKTPGKSDGDNSSYEEQGQSEQNSSVIPQQYSQKQGYSQQQPSSSQNPQKSANEKQKVFPSTSQTKQQIKRSNNHKKHVQNYSIPQPNSQNKKVFCNCKKTKCLKLYCDCFRINQTCDGCNCMGCHNLEEYAEQRNHAILVLMDRNPDPFSQKIQADKHLKGCNCKKSFCLKKYCQCYQAGLKCGQNCKCDQCKNGGGSQKRQKDRIQREGLSIHQIPGN